MREIIHFHRRIVHLRFILTALAFAALLLPAHAQRHSVQGITEPLHDAILSSPVAGIIAQRLVTEGQSVRKGDVLAELDKRLEELDVTRRQAVYEQAKREFEITKTLSEKPNSSTPKAEVEKRALEYSVAKVEFELAQEQFRRRHLAAPFDGVIAELFLQAGEACQVQQPVARLVDTRQCVFISNIEAKAGQSLKLNQSVDLEIDAGASPVRITGRVSFVSPVVDPASGLLKVKITFDNLNGAIRPGVAGKMTFDAVP